MTTNAASEIVACPACARRNRIPRAATGTPRCGSCSAPLPWLVAADDTDFDEVAAGARLPVLVDLWATWCGPCRAVAPAVEQLARDLAGRVKVVKVDVDRAPGVAAHLGVRGVPTLLLLRDGREIGRQVGAVPASRLLEWVRGEVENALPGRP